MSKDIINLENGKYTYVHEEGRQYVLRHGEQWRDLTGDKFTYLLAQEALLANQLRQLLGSVAKGTSVSIFLEEGLHGGFEVTVDEMETYSADTLEEAIQKAWDEAPDEVKHD